MLLFGAWDQNLLTQYHLRYGGRGVMIYWHVEKKSTCIYSQLKTCSSSEVAAMIRPLAKVGFFHLIAILSACILGIYARGLFLCPK